ELLKGLGSPTQSGDVRPQMPEPKRWRILLEQLDVADDGCNGAAELLPDVSERCRVEPVGGLRRRRRVHGCLPGRLTAACARAASAFSQEAAAARSASYRNRRNPLRAPSPGHRPWRARSAR